MKNPDLISPGSANVGQISRGSAGHSYCTHVGNTPLTYRQEEEGWQNWTGTYRRQVLEVRAGLQSLSLRRPCCAQQRELAFSSHRSRR